MIDGDVNLEQIWEPSTRTYKGEKGTNTQGDEAHWREEEKRESTDRRRSYLHKGGLRQGLTNPHTQLPSMIVEHNQIDAFESTDRRVILANTSYLEHYMRNQAARASALCKHRLDFGTLHF